MIPNGVQAIEFRSRTVDTNIAMKKGSIYVGTNTNSVIGGNTVYSVNTINPIDNELTGLQANTIKIPIYNGTAGDTGMAFTQSNYLSVGAADQASQASWASKLGTSSSPCAAGGSAAGSGIGNAVYFSGGVPVALAKVANAVYADNAGTATKLSTSNGSATQPVYFSGGKPMKCTAYADANVNSATVISDMWSNTGTGSTTQFTINISSGGKGIYIASVAFTLGLNSYYTTIVFRYASGNTFVGGSTFLLNNSTQVISLTCNSSGTVTISVPSTTPSIQLSSAICYRLCSLSA